MRFTATMAIAGVLAVCEVSRSQELADRVPADTFLYFSLDSQRLIDGTTQLDLVSLLSEPEVQEFLSPVAEQAPFLRPGAIRAMLEKNPARQFIQGKVEIAVRGVSLKVGQESYEISPSSPINARLVNHCIGMGMGIWNAAENGGILPEISVGVDFVMALEAGPGFPQAMDEVLQELGRELGGVVERTRTQLKGVSVERVSFPMPDLPSGSMDLYVHQDGGRWLISGNPTTMADAVAGKPKHALSGSERFRKFRQQVTAGPPTFLAYLNISGIASMFEKLVPPILMEELQYFGLDAIESAGFASSFTEGGVRDTFALTYSHAPQGFLRLLQCEDGGLTLMRRSPSETGLYIGAKVAHGTAIDRFEEVIEQLFPGSKSAFRTGLQEVRAELGMDLRDGLLPAFGTEVGIYLTAPGSGGMLIPEGMLMVELGERKLFDRLLEQGMTAAQEQGGLKFTQLTSVPAGYTAFSVRIPDVPIQPAFAVSDEYFTVAASPQTLKQALRKLEADDFGSGLYGSPVFQQVVRGLTGSDQPSALDLLVFADLRTAVEVGYQFLPLAASALSAEFDNQLDLALMPEAKVVSRHFSGLAIGARSDDHGLSLSLFTPMGLPSLMGAGMTAAMLEAQPSRPAPSTSTRLSAQSRDAAPTATAAPSPARDSAFLGVNLASTSDGSHGVAVSSVIADTPAAQSGVQDGDVIRAINGHDLASVEDLQALLAGFRPGQKIELAVQRGGNMKVLPLTLGSRIQLTARASVPAEVATSAAPAPARPTEGTEKSLGVLFSNLETALDVTIQFPESFENKQVRYSPRSADLHTILAELSVLAGFDYQVVDQNGSRLVIVTQK